MLPSLRLSRLALLLLAFATPVLPAAVHAQGRPEGVQTSEDPWLYKGSDLVHDDEWKFGRLANGLRYAVRKNGVPPGQMAIRVRIDAGSLMERDSERGFAHLLEHLSFRGSTYVPDGESKRVWQRLGVTFGSDSNAATTFVSTTYKLDLPNWKPEGLEESFKILSGMMKAPAITAQSLGAERPVVLAEGREQPAPQKRMQDALFQLMFAGQPIADREPIGTVEALNAATPQSVQAFHDRWYRPERATVIVIGDVTDAQLPMLEALIGKYFGDWKGVGPAPATPDFGKPSTGHPVAASIVEPAMQPIAMMTIVRPWTVFADTVIFNQKRMIDLVAIRILNRRLESKARAGASFIAAMADLSDIARSANVTTLTVLPATDDWQGALRDVRATAAALMATPPTQAEIDRELGEIDASMRNRIATAPVEAGASIADDLVEAVDINETVTTPEASYAIFKGAIDKGMFTPAAVQASAKKVFEGTATRALVNTQTPDADAVAKVTAALQADVKAAATKRRTLDVRFDQLPKIGKPGTVTSRREIDPDLKLEEVVFANGVHLLMREDSSETGKVWVNVRFGRGLRAMPGDRRTPAFAGPIALMASGIGKFGADELDALTGNRQIGLGFSVDDDAFEFNAQTNKEDLADQLRLFATKLARPGWDPQPVLRAKTGFLSGYAGLSASPDAVLGRDLDALLHDGDPRWGVPSRAELEALTPAAFRNFWEPLLKTGPIEVEVFGDMDAEATIKAVAASFGALAPRAAGAESGAPVRFPAHVETPVVRTHTGAEDQAAAVIAWPTGGGSAGLAESRKLDVLTAVFRDRLIDQLRSQAGVSYSPNVMSDWPVGFDTGGKIVALGMIPPDKTGFFFKLARDIAADLGAKPIDADELARALTPLKQQLLRMSSGNMFWMSLVEGGTQDRARIAAMRTLPEDYARTSPAELQALAAKYLRPDKDWTMVVLPEGGATK
ncbi:M16 family metallopeptidase [Sphingomonas sp. RS6]